MSRLAKRVERLEARHGAGEELVWFPGLPDELCAKLEAATGTPVDEEQRAPRWVPRARLEMPTMLKERLEAVTGVRVE